MKNVALILSLLGILATTGFSTPAVTTCIAKVQIPQAGPVNIKEEVHTGAMVDGILIAGVSDSLWRQLPTDTTLVAAGEISLNTLESYPQPDTSLCVHLGMLTFSQFMSGLSQAPRTPGLFYWAYIKGVNHKPLAVYAQWNETGIVINTRPVEFAYAQDPNLGYRFMSLRSLN